jgi:putative membrane protein
VTVAAAVRPARAVSPVWLLAAAVVLLQVAYPLVTGGLRDGLTVATVVVFFLASVAHAVTTRGASYAAVLVAVTAGGGLLAEVTGVHTGVPFGRYAYTGSLGPRLLGVPAVVPLAWAMFAHPALCVAQRLVPRDGWRRVGVAAWALAAWDVFLDPQMVAAGHWRWLSVGAHLPGIDDVPLTNFAGWLAVAAALMALLSRAPRAADLPVDDRPALALYLWTLGSSVLANLAFFHRPAVAAWGGVAMGLVAVPLVRSLRR